MKKHKILAAALAGVSALSILCGCGGKENAQKTVTPLKMILVGEKPVIYDEIYGKLNEMLRQDIGAEVNIEYYNYSDLKQKYSLLFSSGEDFDIVFSADWIQYNQQAAKNSFMEITDDMLKKNAPKTYEQINDRIKKEVSVNGKMYMVPNTAQEYSDRVAIIRGDLREKYGMKPLETVDDFEKYLEAVAKNESDIIPLVNLEAIAFWMKPYLSIPKSTEIAYEIESGNFVKKDFQDWYVDSIKKTRSLVDKGIIPQDISVISFDHSIQLDFIDPPVTHISQPITNIGTLAIKVLMQEISNRSQKAAQIKLPVKMVIRDSVRNLLQPKEQ